MTEIVRPLFGTTTTTGNVWFVDSGSSAASDTATKGRSKENPFATLDYAFSQATASNGDVIVLMPGHSETITTTNTLALDQAGIQVIGLGLGRTRPTFLIDGGTAAEITVTAADIWVENCVFKAGHADVVNCFDVSSTGFTIVGSEFIDNTTNENFVDFINVSSTTNNVADRLSVIDCVFHSRDANVAGVVQTAGDIDRLRIAGCTMLLGNTDESVIGVATGKDLTNLTVVRNDIDRRTFTTGNLIADPDTTDANTGLIAYNAIGHADTATEVLAPVTCEFRYIENYATAAVDASGYLLPAADS
jgi:hypothetical protein